MEKSFTTFDIVKILGIERNLLAQWLMKGYITPSVRRAKGTGTKNLFSRNDLYKMKLFKQLVDTGILRDEAQFYVNINFSDVGPKKDQYKYQVVIRKKKKFGDEGIITDLSLVKGDPTIKSKDDDSWAMVFDLVGIKTSVDKAIP